MRFFVNMKTRQYKETFSGFRYLRRRIKKIFTVIKGIIFFYSDKTVFLATFDLIQVYFKIFDTLSRAEVFEYIPWKNKIVLFNVMYLFYFFKNIIESELIIIFFVPKCRELTAVLHTP